MKKFLLIMAIAAAMTITSCDSNNNYKSKGEQMSKQLDELCQKQDSATVLALDQEIRDIEEQLAASNDSTGNADFRAALKEAYERNAPYITALKVANGASTEDAVEDLTQKALEGDIDITAITSSIDEVIKEEKKSAKK